MTPWRILGWILLAGSAVLVFLSRIELAAVALACAVVSLIGDAVLRRQSKASQAGMKKCPFCAESIRVEAVKCRHCGSTVA